MNRFWKLFLRSLRLVCPACGKGRLFAGLFRMHSCCPHCGLKLEREPGFYLGSIYINYGITALIAAIAYPALLFNEIVDETSLMIGSLIFVLLFPVLLFRHARSLWLGFDQWHDPREGEQ